MKYLYTGIFFDFAKLREMVDCGITTQRLDRVVENPHVTFTFKPTNVDQKLFGQPGIFKVIGYANDGVNQGLEVEWVSIARSLKNECRQIKKPHITISVSNDGKPVDTGKLQFEPIKEPFWIKGTYGAYTDKGEVILQDPDITVREFCKHKTDARELCVICDSVGWICATVWIDYEDMFCIPGNLGEKVVIRDEWSTLPIVDSYGNTHRIPAHYLYTKD